MACITTPYTGTIVGKEDRRDDTDGPDARRSPAVGARPVSGRAICPARMSRSYWLADQPRVAKPTGSLTWNCRSSARKHPFKDSAGEFAEGSGSGGKRDERGDPRAPTWRTLEPLP
jgi:hypothetical protein